MSDRDDRPTPAPGDSYESPRAEDIDATHGPTEAVAIVQQSPPPDSD